METLNQALSKAMRFCSTKEVCIFDISEKLKKWNINQELHQQIIKSLIEEQFINEQRYANAFVADKFKFNKWGKIKISFYLRKKQIKNSIIQQAIEQIDYQDYSATIEKLIIAKLKSSKERDFLKLKNKIFRHLSSKGYETEAFANKLHILLEKHLKIKQ